jgi:hypothetical protein
VKAATWEAQRGNFNNARRMLSPDDDMQ